MTTDDNITTLQIADAIDAEPLLKRFDSSVREKLAEIVKLLDAGQKIMNLTAIREPLRMVRYHIADSVALDNAVRESDFSGVPQNAADIGTGGGFPLLPMAVLWPATRWVGIESVGKKAAFVERTAHTLGLNGVSVLADRAENVGKSQLRGTFDLVTSRAVGPVASLIEVGMPLLKKGGRLFLFKTESTLPEWKACGTFLAKMGGRPLEEFRYSLEGDEQERLILIAEKVTETPAEFPRGTGVPFKKPMVKVTGTLTR